MSNTRRTTGNGPLRQERFASSQEFERGLMANLVARRCTVLDRAEDRDLIWFLQLLSHQDGGLKQLAADLCRRYPECLASASMRRFGNKPGQVYSASQVQAVRAELSGCFPLKGDPSRAVFDASALLDIPPDDLHPDADPRPASYPAAVFAGHCLNAAGEHLEKHLGCLCLDPALPVADGQPWFFPTLVSTLREFMAGWISRKQPVATTAIGREVFDSLDYALESRRLVLVDGLARIGKTFTAKAWCNLHPGRARYVEAHPMNDDSGFFRAIARTLGVSINLNAKAHRLRDRIEEVLLSGDLLLCLDEAHRLWPQTNLHQRFPTRVNWVMSMSNQGVPVVLITTPQFMRSQKEVETRTCWTSEQFIGRIGHYQKLPSNIGADDLKAVAKALLPDGDARSIEALVLYAQSSAKYLAGIETAVCRARFIAQREQRSKVLIADIKRAIRESVIPSDNAFAAAMQAVNTPARKRAVRVSAAPLQPAFSPSEIRLPVSWNNSPGVLGGRIESVRSPDLVEALG